MSQNFKFQISRDQKNKSNSIVLFFIICYLFIDFMPPFAAFDMESQLYLYIACVNIIISAYCYFNQNSLSQNIISIFKKSYIFKAYTAFLFICSLSIINCNTISLGWMSFIRLLIIFIMLLNIAALLYNRMEFLFKIIFIIGISTLIRNILDLREFIKTLDPNSLNEIYSNINITAAIFNAKVSFLLLGIFHFSNWKRILLSISLLLTIIIILLTASRATYIGLIFQIIIFIFFYIKIYGLEKNNLIRIAGLILLLFLSYSITNQIFGRIKNPDRFKSVENRISQIEISEKPKDVSIKTRFHLWDIGFQLINKKPLLGIGLGNWAIECLPYYNLPYDFDTSMDCHNDFIEIMAETGILNGILYFTIFIYALYINAKRIFKSNNKEIQIPALLCLLLSITYYTDAIFNFPMQVPRMQIGFCFLLALTAINKDANKNNTHYDFKRRITLLTLSIGSICIYFSFYQFKASQLEYKYRISLNNWNENKNEFTAELPKYVTTGLAGTPFHEYLGMSLFYQKKYAKALYNFNLANKINSYTGISDYMIHIIELKNYNTDNAYKYAKSAFYKRPQQNSFYLSAILMSKKKNDIAEMLKIQNIYKNYITSPEDWIHTSDLLKQEGLNDKELLYLIDIILINYPGNELLIMKKKSFKQEI